MSSEDKRDRWTRWGLFAAGFTALWATEKSVGFTRDESVYFAAAETYAGWFRLLWRAPVQAFSDSSIVAAWELNHEHPALMKSLFALSYLVFHDGLGLVRAATAFRIPAFAVAALIPVLVYQLGVLLDNRRAGLFGAVAFLLVPRQFFNAHLACFDVPIAAFWLLTVYAYLRAQQRPWWWLWSGLAFGLALATKHNALFLPFVIGPFALWRAWQQSDGQREARGLFVQVAGVFAAVAMLLGLLWLLLQEKFVTRLAPLSPHTVIFLGGLAVVAWLLYRLRVAHEGTFRAVAPVAAMAALGPLVYYVTWPYQWHHPVDRTAWYLAFHAQHNHYTWFYLNELLRTPPFPLAYVVVVTALTVPTSLFVPMVTGLFSLAGRGGLWLWRGTRVLVRAPTFTECLVAVNAVASIAIISHPDVPHFGGVKHWFPSMPFLSYLAGEAVVRVAAAVRGSLQKRWPRITEGAVAGGLAALLLLPALVATARVHPYGTSYYSELAGGLPGAATLGMQRQFWSNNVTGVLDWLNQNAPRGARVYFHEVNGYSARDYVRNGMLRPDIAAAGGPNDAHLAVYQYHQEFKEHETGIWQAFGTNHPVTGLYVDETPQIVVYARR